MSFEIPSMVPLLVVLAVAGIAVVALVAANAVPFFVRNHRVRVARHEPLVRYYGHLVTGH